MIHHEVDWQKLHKEAVKELIAEFLVTFSTIDNIAKSYEIELPKEYYEEWEKWEERGSS